MEKEENVPQIKNKIENSFYKNFETLLTNEQFEINNDLFKLLYKHSKNNSTKNKISIKLLKEKNKWIPLFNKVKENVTFINELYTDFPIQNTTFNKFKDLYNHLLKLIEPYFKIIESIEQNNYVYKNSSILMDKNNNDIENIYSCIEKKNKNNESNENNILSEYHKKMIEKQKKQNGENGGKKNESKYDYALNASEKYLVKFRRVSLKSFIKGADKLEISKLFYNIRKITQVLVLLKNTIKYYYNNVVNQDLRINLLTLIKVLQGSISRSNEIKEDEEESKEGEGEKKKGSKENERIKIRKAFKQRFLNDENNNYNFINQYNSENNKQLGRNFRSKIKENLKLNN